MNRQKGEAKQDLLVFGAVLLVLFFLWVYTGGPKSFTNGSQSFFQNVTFPVAPSGGDRSSDGSRSQISEYDPEPSTIVIDGVVYAKSPWYRQVDISRGTAARAYLPQDEYVTLRVSRRMDNPVNITGWVLENGENRKLQRTTGIDFISDADRVKIPQGVRLLLGIDNETTGPIVLNPGDRAIVTTGYPPGSSEIDLADSFLTNKCTGYLNEMVRRDFTPSLDRDCPDPEGELGRVRIEDKCFDYISRLRRCHTPDSDPYRDREGDLVRRHLDGVTGLSSQCREFVLATYSYRSCVANHLNGQDFYSDEWRVYLKQNFEMWDEDREVITLYDAQGRLVNQISY